MKISYKMYDIQLMTGVLTRQEYIPMKTHETYAGNASIQKGGSMEERKAMARSSGLAGFQSSIQKHPTSMSKVICKEKEGRATREFELMVAKVTEKFYVWKISAAFFCPKDFFVIVVINE